MLTPIFTRRQLIAALGVCVCLAPALSRPANGDGPALKRLFPAGAQRGATVEVAALGDAPKWPVQVWADDPGIHWEALSDKGKFRVSVDPKVPLGRHAIRFSDADNSTDALRFVIGQLPELNEKEPNDGLDKAQAILDLPKLINGVLEKRSEVDSFAVDLTAGQTLIAAVEAQQGLRAPLDATLQIVSARGSVLAQNLDTVGLDPRIVFVAPREGRYYVRVFGFPETPDSTIGFAGGENFVYRLSLAHGGLLQSSRPLAVSETVETKFELIGIGLQTATATVQVPPGAARATWPLTIDGAMNALMLPVLKIPVLVEQPQPDAVTLQSLPVPCSITGTLERPGQADRYRLSAQKATKLSMELHSREFGYPTDGVLTILDASGKELTRADDVRNDVDAKTQWRPPADGDYTLVVSDAFGAGGSDWHYRVDIQADPSDVVLTMKSDHFQGKINAPLDIVVSIDRRDGYAQPVKLRVIGLPDSAKCPEVVSEKDGKSAKEVILQVTASAPFSGPVRVVGELDSDDKLQRIATAGPDAFISDMWLTIKP